MVQKEPWVTLTGGHNFPNGLFPDLLWFLYDLQPQSFLGRTFALRLLRNTLPRRYSAKHGIPVAQTEIIRVGSRVFIESTRFDRIGADGKRNIVSLMADFEPSFRSALAHISFFWSATARIK